MGNQDKGASVDNAAGSKLVKDGQTVAAIAKSPFGDVEFSRPDSAGVFDQRGGSKSTTAMLATVPVSLIGGLSAVWSCTVYGRLGTDGKFKLSPALPKGIKLTDDGKDAFKAHLNDAILAWSGRDRACRDAHKRMTAPPVDKSDRKSVAARAAEIEIDIAGLDSGGASEPAKAAA